METTKRLIPFIAIHAGEYLKDELDARNMSLAQMSDITGMSISDLREIIRGNQSVDLERSYLLGEALGLNKDFFYKMQCRYEVDAAAIDENITVPRTPLFRENQQQKSSIVVS